MRYWYNEPICRIKFTDKSVKSIEMVESAKSLVEFKDIQTLEDLKTYLINMNHSLSVNKTLVFDEGNGPFLIIGEAPGVEENKLGRPFIGKSGQLMRTIMTNKLQNITWSDLSIINIIPWQPEGNRTPTWAEILEFIPILHKQIEIRKPKAILCLGNVAARALFANDKIKITTIRGELQYFHTCDAPIPVICTLHPAGVLRNEGYLSLFEQDIQSYVTLIRSLL